MKIVHNFNNSYIKDFLERFANIITNLPVGDYTHYQIGCSNDHIAFKYSLPDDKTPFGTCDDRISINEAQCDKLGFDDGERDACLFHEIGHILCPVEEDGLEKELIADNAAIENGLREQLISALKKMANSDDFCKEARAEMINRVQHWSEYKEL